MILNGNIWCDNTDIIDIKGICASEPIKTLGTVKLTFDVNGKLFPHKIHLLPRGTNVPLDGLLGTDF